MCYKHPYTYNFTPVHNCRFPDCTQTGCFVTVMGLENWACVIVEWKTEVQRRDEMEAADYVRECDSDHM